MDEGMMGYMASQSTVPQAPQGDLEQMRARIISAMKILEGALPVFTSISQEGKAIMSALKPLAQTFGEAKAQELTATENMNTMANIPQNLKSPEQTPLGMADQAQQGRGGNIPPEIIQQIMSGGGM